MYIKLQDKHFLQTRGSHLWKLAKACLYKEIIYSVLENNFITWDQTEWEVAICKCMILFYRFTKPDVSIAIYINSSAADKTNTLWSCCVISRSYASSVWNGQPSSIIIKLPLWPHINIVLLFLVVERGLNYYSISFYQVCIPIIPKQRNDMYQKIIINRDIAIWSFISVLIWEQIVYLILLSIANNMTYFKFLFLGSFLPHKLIWHSPYCRGMICYLHFRRHIRFTNYNFHTHVVYCITIHYHICHIDK